MNLKTNKPDGECDFPGCSNRMDFSRHDKPLPGWAHVVMNRYVSSGKDKRKPAERPQSITLLLCPECTISFSKRQVPLTIAAAPAQTRRVIIESPFAGDVERNVAYLRAAMRDALLRGDAPFASHAIYTQPGVLDDEKPEERTHGIQAGFAWMEAAKASVVYEDLGLSNGMKLGLERAAQLGLPIERRRINWRP